MMLDGELPRLRPVEGFSNGINGHVSVTKVSIQVGVHHLLFDLDRDGLCLI